MPEIIMGKNKKIGDSAFITEIEKGVLVLGKPDVLKNPMTGNLEKISQVIVTDKVTYCPKCKSPNEAGVEITIAENGLCVFPCKKCKQFIWFIMR